MRIARTLTVAAAVVLTVVALGACDSGDKHKIEIKTEPGKVEIETK